MRKSYIYLPKGSSNSKGINWYKDNSSTNADISRSLADFTAWVEDCYCNSVAILIRKEDEDGSCSTPTDMLQVSVEADYMLFEDDRDYFEKIKLANIKSIIERVGEFENKIFEIKTKNKTYTFNI